MIPRRIVIAFLLCLFSFETVAAREVVTAVVVKSWDDNYHLLWDDLNNYWYNYGDTQIIIDHTTLMECNINFTLADLENVGADVVIVSNPAGRECQWQQSEVDALEAYVAQGHTLIGTYLLYQNGVADNRVLAPLWGHRSDLDYANVDASSVTYLLDPGHCLFMDIDDPMIFGGYMRDMVPEDESWDEGDLNGAYYAGRSNNGRNVVTVYEASNYNAFYISNMPEYTDDHPRTDAGQWLYNAIVCEPGPVAVIDIGELTTAQLIGIYPNPFNPQTTITFSLARDEWAEIAVLDLTGKQIAVLDNRTYDAGDHSVVWNGKDAMGRSVPSGTYVVRLETDSGVEARKVMLLR